MTKKIFISGINTELGYHLTQTLRRDHIYLQNYPLIAGSTVPEQKDFMLHESIHQTFNFKEQRDAMMRSIIGADVVIVDLRYHVEQEVEIILQVLRHCEINHKIKVIGVSSHGTWCNGPSVQFKTSQQSSSRQTLLEHSLNKSHWRQHQLNPRWYKLRNPHPSFVYNYNLEEQLLSLPQFQPFIESMILCTGVMFGKSGMDLRDEISRAVNFKQSAFEAIPKKHLPITSVDTLLNKIQDVVYCTNPKFQEYMVLCEDYTFSITDLLEMINQQCGNLKNTPQQSKGVTEQLPRTMEGNRPSNMLEVPEARGNSNSSKLGSGHQLMNQPSGRSTSQQPLLLPLSNVNSSRGSSQNFTSIEQQIFSAQTPRIIPEIRYAKDKRMMLLGGAMGVRFKKEEQEIRENDGQKDLPKEHGHEEHLALSDGNQLQAAKGGLKSIVSQIIDDYLQYWEQGYFRFIIPEETIQSLTSDHNTNYDNAAVVNKMLRCCPILNTVSLNATIEELIRTGTIPHERLITPEDHKKNRKDNSRESVVKKELYETFLKEGLLGWLGQNVNKSFGVCLKSQLLEKVLQLVKEDQELHAVTRQVQFVFLGIENGQNHQNQHQMSRVQSDPQVSRSVDLFSAQFCELFSIVLDQKTRSPQKEGNKEQSVRTPGNTKQLGQGSSLEQGQTKINLISQYLLDNVVVYLAQAKQRLNTTTAGQQIEPKQHLKLLLQQLKLIRSRQVASMEDQYQTQN